MLLPLVAVLSTNHYEADVPVAGGDYVDVAFEVPAGTQEIRIAHSDGSEADILDWGVWSPAGFRGYGGGLTEDAVIGVEQSSRGYLPGPIAAGTWTVMVGKAKLGPAGGHYLIDVTCSDVATLPVVPRAPFAATVLDGTRRWYKGDFHVHSRESGDASATFDELRALATSRGLDFVVVSDHNTVSHHAPLAAYQAAHPELLIMRGAEITTYAGHGNAIGLASYVEHRIGRSGRAIGGVLDDVAAQGALFVVNHPRLDLGAACIGCAWGHAATDWAKVAGLELITGNWDFGVATYVPQVMAMWDGLLDQGHRLAAIGGSDDHTAGRATGATSSPIGSPTTLVLADNLSEAAILEGVRRGRTIVQLRGPDDPRVAVTMAARDGRAELGDQVDGVSHAELSILVTGGAGTVAQVWRDGVRLERQLAVTADDFGTGFDDTPGAGDHRYRVELVSETGRRLVVTSHIYVHAVDPPGGCGCSGGAGGSGGAAVLGVAFVVARRRRRRAA